jgi:DtxR family Mn-dependent transcriptional regulator
VEVKEALKVPPMSHLKLTISKEDYLKAIAEAESEEGTVIAATIARWLGVTPPAVALALRRLRRDKLVEIDRKGLISLTPSGRQISDRLRFRHHLVERMLTEMLGMEWYKVHEEAERLEHAVSDDLERKLIEKLGEEGPCPHGNEINTGTADRRKSGLRLLAEVPAGTRVKVVGMYERDRSLLEYFNELGLRPGSQAQVLSRNYDETMTLDCGVKQVHLGQAAAKRVWVRSEERPRG